MPAEIKVLALQSPQIVINEIAADFALRTGYRIKQLLDHAEMPIHIEHKINTGRLLMQPSWCLQRLIDWQNRAKSWGTLGPIFSACPLA